MELTYLSPPTTSALRKRASRASMSTPARGSVGTGVLVLAPLRYAQVSKETYVYGKRGLFIWQKRPIDMAKEAY